MLQTTTKCVVIINYYFFVAYTTVYYICDVIIFYSLFDHYILQQIINSIKVNICTAKEENFICSIEI